VQGSALFCCYVVGGDWECALPYAWWPFFLGHFLPSRGELVRGPVGFGLTASHPANLPCNWRGGVLWESASTRSDVLQPVVVFFARTEIPPRLGLWASS
jgi:hypothetical protein